jgi:tRNA uridine 5-carboxymethylaminomethyl modification enzyme
MYAQENADLRLTQRGYDAGVVCEERFAKFATRRQRVRDGVSMLKAFGMSASEWKNAG